MQSLTAETGHEDEKKDESELLLCCSDVSVVMNVPSFSSMSVSSEANNNLEAVTSPKESLGRLRQMKRQIRGERASWQVKLKSMQDQVAALQAQLNCERHLHTQQLATVRTTVRKRVSPAQQRQLVVASLIEEVNPIHEYLHQRAQGLIPVTKLHSEMAWSRMLEDELQERDFSLAQAYADLEELHRDLQSADEQCEYTAGQVTQLNDQADAYAEHLRNLQEENTRLDITLTEAECRISEILTEKENEDCDSIEHYQDADPGNPVGREDSAAYSSPLLEEALTLAKGLTGILNGQQEEGGNVLNILESFSTMMEEQEQHDLTNLSSMSLPYHDCQGEKPPSPVYTPAAIPSCTTLSLPYDQLLERCRLVEFERLDIQKTTLDVLETSRHAIEAQVQAAVATARRQWIEEDKTKRFSSRGS